MAKITVTPEVAANRRLPRWVREGRQPTAEELRAAHGPRVEVPSDVPRPRGLVAPDPRVPNFAPTQDRGTSWDGTLKGL